MSGGADISDLSRMAGSAAAYIWLAHVLLVALPPLSLATVLLERSGPIRMRHWVEETGGRLRRLWEDPARFGLYRYLLNLSAKLVPLVLCLALGRAGERLGMASPFLYAVASVGASNSAVSARYMLRNKRVAN